MLGERCGAVARLAYVTSIRHCSDCVITALGHKSAGTKGREPFLITT